MSFSELELLPELEAAVQTAGYTTPTPIQAQAIPPLLEGRDLLGCARTGTGKTAAFALPILQHLAQSQRRPAAKIVRSLVLVPTRELAAQVADSFRKYGSGLNLSVVLVHGGVGQNPQAAALRRGVDVLVACPGRLVDLMGQRLVDLSQVEVLVLDEADHMLDLGFIPDVRRIVAQTPRRRQTLLFSATMPAPIQGLADSFLVDPVKVFVTPQATPAEAVSQEVHFVESSGKPDLLARLLRSGDVERALVFTRTKRGANRVAERLAKNGIPAEAIHGNKSQNARTRALEGFKRGQPRVLVATDVAARGIDVHGVSHVVNYELPEVPETYVHRIGRTARAGASGIAISLCASDERDQLKGIEKLLRKQVAVASGERGRVTSARREPRSRRPSPSGSRASRRGNARSW
ncbi:MAG TPA: DEAD/DEAH box helicase [Myxococcota bacterium]|nr:DEAD/DEAH box helicase [Myxococcota bacterium]